MTKRMFEFICLCAIVSAAAAASIGKVESTTEKREIIPLIKFERENNPDGSFSFSYEGGDQSFREETAHVVDAGTEDEALEVSGSYRYIDQDGNNVEVHYTAGRNGFVPVGTHILSEISDVAKAAAKLPQINEEEEYKRKGRSKDNADAGEQSAEETKVSEQKVKSPNAAEKQEKDTKKDEAAKVKAATAEKAKQIPVIVVEEGAKLKAETA